MHASRGSTNAGADDSTNKNTLSDSHLQGENRFGSTEQDSNQQDLGHTTDSSANGLMATNSRIRRNVRRIGVQKPFANFSTNAAQEELVESLEKVIQALTKPSTNSSRPIEEGEGGKGTVSVVLPSQLSRRERKEAKRRLDATAGASSGIEERAVGPLFPAVPEDIGQAISKARSAAGQGPRQPHPLPSPTSPVKGKFIAQPSKRVSPSVEKLFPAFGQPSSSSKSKAGKKDWATNNSDSSNIFAPSPGSGKKEGGGGNNEGKVEPPSRVDPPQRCVEVLYNRNAPDIFSWITTSSSAFGTVLDAEHAGHMKARERGEWALQWLRTAYQYKVAPPDLVALAVAAGEPGYDLLPPRPPPRRDIGVTGAAYTWRHEEVWSKDGVSVKSSSGSEKDAGIGERSGVKAASGAVNSGNRAGSRLEEEAVGEKERKSAAERLAEDGDEEDYAGEEMVEEKVVLVDDIAATSGSNDDEALVDSGVELEEGGMWIWQKIAATPQNEIDMFGSTDSELLNVEVDAENDGDIEDSVSVSCEENEKESSTSSTVKSTRGMGFSNAKRKGGGKAALGSQLLKAIASRMKEHPPKVIVIGDVHGCIDELKDLLVAADYRPGDLLLFLGDLVAKGPDSVGVVRMARELGGISVRGNHEFEVLRWQQIISGGADQPLLRSEHYQIAQGLAEEDVEWLRCSPWYIHSKELEALFVHAGFVSGVRLTRQNPRLMMNMRSILPDGTATSKHHESYPWARLWSGPQTVYFGHDAERGMQKHACATGLDTGCVYGGRLSACLLPEGKVVSVPAHQEYITFKRKRTIKG